MSRPVDIQRYMDTLEAVFIDTVRRSRKSQWDLENNKPDLNNYYYRAPLTRITEEADQWIRNNPAGVGKGVLLRGGDRHLGHGHENSHIPDVTKTSCFYRFIRVTTPQKRNDSALTVLATFYLAFPDADTWDAIDMRVAREFRGLPPCPYFSVSCGGRASNLFNLDSLSDRHGTVIRLAYSQLPRERKRRIRLEATGTRNDCSYKIVFTSDHPFNVGTTALRETLALLLENGITSVDVDFLKRAISANDS